MANIGGSPKSDSRPLAPVADDGFGVASECRIIDRYVVHAAHPDRGRAAYRWAARDMEHRPVDPVFMLGDILDQQLNIREVGLDRSPEEIGQHRKIEGHCPL